jgi:transcriptional regulator MraZ
VSGFYFSGSSTAKIDEKNRFVLPQAMRYGLVDDGKCEFTICIGMNGCLNIYRRNEIEKIAKKFSEKQHVAKYQKFFTLFFSTLFHTTCDKVGRVVLPAQLKKLVNIDKEIVVAGVLDKIELWPKELYEQNMERLLNEADVNEITSMSEEVFGLLHKDNEVEKLNESHIERAQDLIRK